MPAAAPIVFVVMIETRRGLRGAVAVCPTEAAANRAAMAARRRHRQAWYVPMPVEG